MEGLNPGQQPVMHLRGLNGGGGANNTRKPANERSRSQMNEQRLRVCFCARATVTRSFERVHLQFVGWQVKAGGGGGGQRSPPGPAEKAADLLITRTRALPVEKRRESGLQRQHVRARIPPETHVAALRLTRLELPNT